MTKNLSYQIEMVNIKEMIERKFESSSKIIFDSCVSWKSSEGLILSVILILNPITKKLENIAVDILHEDETNEKNLLPLHFFAGMKLKRLGQTYTNLRKLIPKNISRIILGEEASKCALAQRIEPGALFFGQGVEDKMIYCEDFCEEFSTKYQGNGS